MGSSISHGRTHVFGSAFSRGVGVGLGHLTGPNHGLGIGYGVGSGHHPGFGHGFGLSYGYAGAFTHGYGHYGHQSYSYYPYTVGYGSYYPYYYSGSYTYAPLYVEPVYVEPVGGLDAEPADDIRTDSDSDERRRNAGRPTIVPPTGDRPPSIPDGVAVSRPLVETDEPPEVLPPDEHSHDRPDSSGGMSSLPNKNEPKTHPRAAGQRA